MYSWWIYYLKQQIIIINNRYNNIGDNGTKWICNGLSKLIKF